MKPNKGFITVLMMVLISISLSTFSRAAFDTFSDVPNDTSNATSLVVILRAALRIVDSLSIETISTFSSAQKSRRALFRSSLCVSGALFATLMPLERNDFSEE